MRQVRGRVAWYVSNHDQVDFEAKAAKKIADENGEINREDFFKFAIDTKLLDFGQAIGEVAKQKKQAGTRDGREGGEKKCPGKVISSIVLFMMQHT